jgi:puromycin-sensitive aminopeptidase
MTFSGQLNDKMKGFYRSKYINLKGEEEYGAVTQFEVRMSLIFLVDIPF